MRYQLKLWNKKYGKSAKWVVYDTETKKYALFSVDKTNDLAWVDADLTKDSEYKGWDNWNNEPVDNLSDVII